MLKKTVGMAGGEKHAPGKNGMFQLHTVNFFYILTVGPCAYLFSAKFLDMTQKRHQNIFFPQKLSAREIRMRFGLEVTFLVFKAAF